MWHTSQRKTSELLGQWCYALSSCCSKQIEQTYRLVHAVFHRELESCGPDGRQLSIHRSVSHFISSDTTGPAYMYAIRCYFKENNEMQTICQIHVSSRSKQSAFSPQPYTNTCNSNKMQRRIQSSDCLTVFRNVGLRKLGSRKRFLTVI